MPPRLKTLDGLRGWLSLMVVFSHVAAFRWIPLDAAPAPSPLLQVMWHLGAPAVDAFFVLSGLVVGRSLTRRPRPYLTYLGERARRLLPVGAVGLGLGFAIRALTPHMADNPVKTLLETPLTAQDWAGIFTLGLIPYQADSLNPPLWSLVIEQHVALLMPLLVLAARRGLLSSLLTALGAMFLGLLVHDPLYALWFVPAFLVGIALDRVRVPQKAALPLLLAGLLLWQHRQFTGDSVFYRQTAMLGAALLLAGLRGMDARQVLPALLLSPVSQWLGRVSYSLYATHFLALSLGAALLPDPLLGAALGVPLALLVAQLTWQFVERPFSAPRAARPLPVPEQA